MQGQSQQQAYDRGITIFSPDGRLYQVEYAREAVKRGTASVGVRTEEGVVLVVDKRTRSPLMETESIEKLHKADEHVGIASAGHVADARRLIDFARRQAQAEQFRYDEPISVESLTKAITDHIQEYTQMGGVRPYGAALLVAGVSDGEPQLFETDPSGTPNEWKAIAIGSNRADVQDFLEQSWSEELSLDEGIDLALRALAQPHDDGLSPEGVGVATVDVDTEKYDELSGDEIESHLESLDLLESEDEEDEKDEEDEETDGE